MAKINKEEYEVLKSLEDEWRWIARDSGGGGTYTYQEKPYKRQDTEDWGDGSNEWLHIDDYTEWLNIDYYLLQFIQWEDEEPWNIQELIEEYEGESKVQGTDILFNSLDEPQSPPIPGAESEEKEMKKDKKWLLDKWTKERNETDVHDPTYQYASEFIADINQLDEPEVLSSDWIKDNQLIWTSTHGAGSYIPSSKLYGKIVPKQELTVIPNYVAEWVSVHHDAGFDLYPALKRLENNALSWDDVYEWYRGNTHKFVNAYLTGEYELEERELTVKEVIEEHIELLKKQEVAVNLKPYYDLWEELKEYEELEEEPDAKK